MALEMTKDTMTWKQRKGTHHSRILLEGDMIVPDNRPDVAQVLHCSGTVRLDEVKSGEEKLISPGNCWCVCCIGRQAAKSPCMP